jgi:hypothetical protein
LILQQLVHATASPHVSKLGKARAHKVVLTSKVCTIKDSTVVRWLVWCLYQEAAYLAAGVFVMRMTLQFL